MTILGLPTTSKTPSTFIIEPFEVTIFVTVFCETSANLFVLATLSKNVTISSGVSPRAGMFDCKAAMYTSYEEFTSFTAKPVISILGLLFILASLVDKAVEVIGLTLSVVMPFCNWMVYD